MSAETVEIRDDKEGNGAGTAKLTNATVLRELRRKGPLTHSVLCDLCDNVFKCISCGKVFGSKKKLIKHFRKLRSHLYGQRKFHQERHDVRKDIVEEIEERAPQGLDPKTCDFLMLSRLDELITEPLFDKFSDVVMKMAWLQFLHGRHL